ncbi:Endomembrane protein 70 protein family [Perilla frutescens var. hirtella]|nr:Endomembrane protein 70 protein family [Perilla frutescens var. hirtella]
MTGACYAVVLVVTWIAVGVSSNAFDHIYKAGDTVPLYASKVYPFGNPSETYRYYSLPFCSPVSMRDESEASVEGIKGDRLVHSPYNLQFLVDKDSEVLCQKKLSKKEVADFRSAVSRDYLFQMHYDDLPIWGFLGRIEKNGSVDPRQYKYYLNKHLHFKVFYNKNRIINIQATTDPYDCVELTDDKDVLVDFLYTVKWNETGIAFEKRMEMYARSYLEILSVIASCVTVLLLTGFLVAILLQALKNDLVKYAHDEETADDKEKAGWKFIHGDVFRFPKNKSLLAAALGSGTQLVVLATLILLLALVGAFYNGESPFTTLGVIYTTTSFIAGYTTASFYSQLEGTYWVSNLLLTGVIFSGPMFLIFSFLNAVAIAYKETAVLPVDTTIGILQIWVFIASPLLVLGWIAGKYSMADFEAPCPTSKYPRKILPLPWYRWTLPQMAVAGFLPFCASYGELYYIFSGVWGHKLYTNYSILFVVFIIVLIVTAFTTMALIYFQLAAEDHDWWWRSFLYGGSSGLYIYGYCLYYYYAHSGMSGFMQTSFFFGYMAFVSYAIFVMLGAVGFYAALFFVRRIYGSIKND